MSKLTTPVLLALLPMITNHCLAQTIWKITIPILGAAQSMDVASSVGAYEANPLARNSSGRFSSARAVPIKIGVTVGIVLLQRHIIRRHPKSAKVFAAQNVAMSAAIGAVAVRNWKIKNAR